MMQKSDVQAKCPKGGGGLPVSNISSKKDVVEMNISKKPVIIAGNGPSLARIDYSRLPCEFDVYRCNQFYFEDKYYLGKRVTSVFFNPMVFYEQYFTLKNLQERGEYSYERLYSSKMLWGTEELRVNPFFNMVFPDTIELYSIMREYPKVHAFLKYNDLFHGQRATSGVLMLLAAAINGYREMHLIGIDFYEGGDYGFEFRKKNLLRLVHDLNNQTKTKQHSKSFDLQAIEVIAEYFDLKLYDLSLDESHPLGLPKSPVVNSGFTLEDKPKDYIKDVMIPKANNPLAYRGISESDLMRDIYQRVYTNTFKRWYMDMKKLLQRILRL